MDCIFCKIANSQMKAEVVYEDDHATAILDIHPCSSGHTMILPKVHAQNILELPDGRIEGVFGAVKKVTALLNKALKPEGFTIGINHGLVSGQTVDHLHIHVIPRYTGDGGRSIHSVVQSKVTEDVAEVAKRIREAA